MRFGAHSMPESRAGAQVQRSPPSPSIACLVAPQTAVSDSPRKLIRRADVPLLQMLDTVAKPPDAKANLLARLGSTTSGS